MGKREERSIALGWFDPETLLVPNKTEKKVLQWWKIKALSYHNDQNKHSYFINSLLYLLCKWYYLSPIELFETDTLSSPFSRWKKKYIKEVYSLWICFKPKHAESRSQSPVILSLSRWQGHFTPTLSEVIVKLFLNYIL